MAQRKQTSRKAAAAKAPARKKQSGDGAARRPKPQAAEVVLNRTGLTRLGKGELAAQVLAHLKGHPKAEFTPTELSHKLDRSSGAIQNACERAVEEGHVVRSSNAPKRYRYAGAKAPRRPRPARKA